MKKLFIGCLVIVVIAAIGIATASYFAYRAASPYLQKASDYMSALKTLPELEQKIAIKSSFAGPANGELTPQQVDRFARVQDRVRQNLGTRVEEIDKKHASLKSSESPSPAEALSVVADLLGLFIDARRYQVEALNAEQFSQSEYDWVRTRVYAAAGVQFTTTFDLRKIEEMARSGQEQIGMTPNFALPDVPDRNRELVKPHMTKMEKWVPLAFFGL